MNDDDAQGCAGCGGHLWLLNQYRGIRVLGQGGFGRTVLAETRDQQRVVIKQLRETSPAALQRFQQEAAQLQRLACHPQIPALIEFIEDAGYGPLLIQAYVAGPNLAQVLDQQGALPAPQVEQLLRDLLPVLEYIHSFRVIHRDIKPENILLPEGQLPMLVDFGAATEMQRTRNTVIGSAEYVAPEQAMGQANVASDLYSLGVTCLHALTGLPPFDLYSVSEDRWVWRNFLTTPVGARLGAVLDRLVVRAYRDRLPNAAAALQALDQPVLPLQKPAQALQDLQSKLKLAVVPNPVKATPLPRKSEQPWDLLYQIPTQGIVQALAVSREGVVALGDGRGAIALHRLSDGSNLYTFKARRGLLPWGEGHRDQVSGLCFAPNSRYLYSTSYDGTTKIWDVKTCTLQRTLPRHGWIPADVVLSPQRLVVAGGEGCISLWDSKSWQQKATLTQHQDRVSALGLTATGQRLASVSWDGTLRLWQLPHGELLETLAVYPNAVPPGKVTALALHPAGLHAVTGGSDGTVQVWSLASPISAETIYTSPDAVTALALSPDARLLAVGTEGNTLSLWDGATGRCVAKLEHGWGLVDIAFAADGQRLITSSRDETVSVWASASAPQSPPKRRSTALQGE
ncbi:MAG: serine/threonine-protein kinase [Cyanobacteria bacterium J06632_22]